MSITEASKLLVRGLQFFPLTEREQEAIFLILESDEEKMLLMEYMANHEHATAQELKNEVGRILKMFHKK